jgi:hypothetical protein
MTMQRLDAFGKVWKDSPPQHVSLARITKLLKAFMGVKETDSSSPDIQAAEHLMNLPEIEE